MVLMCSTHCTMSVNLGTSGHSYNHSLYVKMIHSSVNQQCELWELYENDFIGQRFHRPNFVLRTESSKRPSTIYLVVHSMLHSVQARDCNSLANDLAIKLIRLRNSFIFGHIHIPRLNLKSRRLPAILIHYSHLLQPLSFHSMLNTIKCL